VQQLANIGAAVTQALEPFACHQPVRVGRGEPRLDARIAPNGALEAQQLVVH